MQDIPQPHREAMVARCWQSPGTIQLVQETTTLNLTNLKDCRSKLRPRKKRSQSSRRLHVPAAVAFIYGRAASLVGQRYGTGRSRSRKASGRAAEGERAFYPLASIAAWDGTWRRQFPLSKQYGSHLSQSSQRILGLPSAPLRSVPCDRPHSSRLRPIDSPRGGGPRGIASGSLPLSSRKCRDLSALASSQKIGTT